MADSTAPLLMAGGATALADYMEGHGVEWRVILATGLAASVFALLEKANHQLAVGGAWVAFVGSMVAPRSGGRPSPISVFLDQWNRTTPTNSRS